MEYIFSQDIPSMKFPKSQDMVTKKSWQKMSQQPKFAQDYQALLRLGPLDFLFHSADVPRAVSAVPAVQARLGEMRIPGNGGTPSYDPFKWDVPF